MIKIFTAIAGCTLAGMLLFSGCTSARSFYVRYDVPMVNVERPVDVKQRYGDVETITLTDSNKYFYADSLIDATFVVLSSSIDFSLTNKSEHTMKLIWDESGMIEPDNSLTRVMHTGVKYSERNNSMPASIIPRRGKIEDQATPVNRVYYNEGYYSQSISIPGGWNTTGIFPSDTTITNSSAGSIKAEDAEPFFLKAKKNIGTKIGLLLPLEIEGVKNEYTFWFQVKDVKLDTTGVTRIY
jgi:hypothetical protein